MLLKQVLKKIFGHYFYYALQVFILEISSKNIPETAGNIYSRLAVVFRVCHHLDAL